MSRPVKICSVEGCGSKHKAIGYCNAHYFRVKRYGDLNHVGVGKPHLGAGHHNWRGDNPSYLAAHGRVSRMHGSAREWWCEHCDSRAHHWAYDHKDTEKELEDPETGCKYSPDPERYFPLCVPCHKVFDGLTGLGSMPRKAKR